MEQGSKGFMDFLAEVGDQMHLCHSWEQLTSKDTEEDQPAGHMTLDT